MVSTAQKKHQQNNYQLNVEDMDDQRTDYQGAQSNYGGGQYAKYNKGQPDVEKFNRRDDDYKARPEYGG